ncbi:hypothetical protein Ahy_B08g093477 [Arachis hypogaea]|uniref:Uncharacterized protein n=1 Tax=Arachis hypogaea TaxID=3818 RepID=A0A444Y656_ARAHY|nr:hypothetical protein Ahy_B08g093477 [Arachis hypogaea]
MFDVHARLMPQHVMEWHAMVRDVVVGDGSFTSSPQVVLLDATLIHYTQGDGTSSSDEHVLETPTGGGARFGGAHTCLAPTMSQDHTQLDSSLNCKVVLPIIKTDLSVCISMLQSVMHQSYHFKSSYRKMWMAKQKSDCSNLW